MVTEELTFVVKADTKFLEGLLDELSNAIAANEKVKRYIEEHLDKEALKLTA